jgi:hypothetical protein
VLTPAAWLAVARCKASSSRQYDMRAGSGACASLRALSLAGLFLALAAGTRTQDAVGSGSTAPANTAASVTAEYESWKLVHNLLYDAAEDAARFRQWSATRAFVLSQPANRTYTITYTNHLAAASPEERAALSRSRRPKEPWDAGPSSPSPPPSTPSPERDTSKGDTAGKMSRRHLQQAACTASACALLLLPPAA